MTAKSEAASMDDLPLGPGVLVLNRHPCGLVALEKPEGILTVPNKDSDLKTSLLRAPYDVQNECYHWRGEDGQERRLYVCHRLDSPTSGVLLCAIGASVAHDVKSLFKTRNVEKEYRAVIAGIPQGARGVWKDRLKASKEETHLRTRADALGGKESVTEWQTLGNGRRGGYSLLALHPLTGRTHQLRVQTSMRRFPIVGDRTYGDFRLNARLRKEQKIRRLLLHAHRIRIEGNIAGAFVHFEAVSAVPQEFFQLIDKP
jgi:tRNA pseudouridine65 synthase